MTTGAVYSNFDGKDDLPRARRSSDRPADRGVRAVTEPAREPGGVEAAITTQFENFFDETASFPLLFHEFWSYGARNPELRDEFAARREAVVDAMAEAIAAAAEASDRKLAVPARTVAVAVRAAMNGLAFDRAIDGGSCRWRRSAGRWAPCSEPQPKTTPRKGRDEDAETRRRPGTRLRGVRRSRGPTVVFHHGTGDSRLARHPDESLTADAGVRLLTVDRPGVGASTRLPDRSLLDWPADLEAARRRARARGVHRGRLVGRRPACPRLGARSRRSGGPGRARLTARHRSTAPAPGIWSRTRTCG